MTHTFQQFSQSVSVIKSCNQQILALADCEDWDVVKELVDARDKMLLSIFPLEFDIDVEIADQVRFAIQDMLCRNDLIIKQARGIRVKFMNEKIRFNENQKAIKAYTKVQV